MNTPPYPKPPRERVRWLSVILSAALWGSFLSLVPGRAFWRNPGGGDLPAPWLPHLILLAGLFLVALWMHWPFAGMTARLSGWRFLLFPFITIPLAGALAALPFAVATMVSNGLFSSSEPGGVFVMWIYTAVYMVYLSLTMYLWITYPFALINQIIIRHFYSRAPGRREAGTA